MNPPSLLERTGRVEDSCGAEPRLQSCGLVQGEIRDWHDLEDALFAGSWREDIGRFRSTNLFRGVSSASHGLMSSLQTGHFLPHERHLLRSFRKYALRSAVRGDSVWNWLSVAKHHGLPTRLLDWSYSPFVALHFVTENQDRYDQDGAVYCVDYGRTIDALPRRVSEPLRREGAQIFTTELLDEVASTLSDFDGVSKEPFLLFFEPPSIDERIVNQFALFSLPSPADLDLESYLRAHEAFRRIRIPASLKWEIRDRLDQLNVTERVLFPGLDGLSQWLRRYFTTRQS